MIVISTFYLSLTNNDNILHLSLSACIPHKIRITNISLISVRKTVETPEQFSNRVLSGQIGVNGLQLDNMMELMLLEEVSTGTHCLAINTICRRWRFGLPRENEPNVRQ